MKRCHLPSGLLQAIPFIIPANWSAEQALAVFELLDDLRHQIWTHYQVPLCELLREQRRPFNESDTLNLPFDDPPF